MQMFEIEKGNLPAQFLLWKKEKSNLDSPKSIHVSELTLYWLDYWHTLISKDTSGFMSSTLLIRLLLDMHIVYRMHKVERRMAKTNAMNTQGDKIKAIYCDNHKDKKINKLDSLKQHLKA